MDVRNYQSMPRTNLLPAPISSGPKYLPETFYAFYDLLSCLRGSTNPQPSPVADWLLKLFSAKHMVQEVL